MNVRKAVQAAIDRLHLPSLRPLKQVRFEVKLDSVGELAVFVTAILEKPVGAELWPADMLRPLENRILANLREELAPWLDEEQNLPFIYIAFRLESETGVP